MTVSLAGVRSAPLHELEAAWKAEGQVAYAPGSIVAMPCLCGGIIRARAMEDRIVAAVRLHNASTAHEQWAIAAGWR
jgi:hypothetical protein